MSWRKIPDNGLGGVHLVTMGQPVNALLPANTLNVEFSFDADHPLPLNSYPTETVLPGSTIDLSGLAHFVELPRLDLFTNAGYPFTEFADLSRTAVMLPRNASVEQIALFLGVLGFLGARTGYPAIRVTVVHPDEPDLIAGKNLLAIDPSNYQSGPSSFTNGPASFVNGTLRLRDTSALWNRLPLENRLTENHEKESLVSADPKPEAYLSEFSSGSPFSASSKQHSTVLVIDSITSSQTNGLEDLFTKETGIASVYGTLSALQGGLFHSFNTGTRIYGSGNLHWPERCRLWIKRNYWALPILVVLVILVMSSLMAAWLEERAQLRLEMKI